ncbi:MAG: hypothetical protein IKE75_04955 [Bacilli bacterium]|nr:hypothetical protein [Bacilli bacterium]
MKKSSMMIFIAVIYLFLIFLNVDAAITPPVVKVIEKDNILTLSASHNSGTTIYYCSNKNCNFDISPQRKAKKDNKIVFNLDYYNFKPENKLYYKVCANTLGGTCITDSYIVQDTTPKMSTDTDSDEPFEYENQSLKFHINWQDYGNKNSTRPEKVKLVLKNTVTNLSYNMILKENNVYFENDETYSKFVSNESSDTKTATKSNDGTAWTMRIDNLKIDSLSLDNNYQLEIADDSKTEIEENYIINQTGSTLNCTLKNYDYMSNDAKAELTAENGKLYDGARNLVVLKGVVTPNAGTAQFDAIANDESAKSLKALKKMGVNSIRVTVQIKSTGPTGYDEEGNPICGDDGYIFDCDGELLANKEPKDPITYTNKKQENVAKIHNDLRKIVNLASQNGIYTIINWGILEETGNPNSTILKDNAKNFFGALSKSFINNPYVLYEICNEPHKGENVWENEVVPYAKDIYRIIRDTNDDGVKDNDAVIIVAPKGSATELVTENGDDPYNKPLTWSDGSPYYNVAYTYHSYPYNYAYNDPGGENKQNGAPIHSNRLKSVIIDKGLTIIVTEFASMNARHTQNKSLFDNDQIAKYAYLFYMNDISFNYFKYDFEWASGNYSEWHILQRRKDGRDSTTHFSNLDLDNEEEDAKTYYSGNISDKYKGIGVYTNSGCWFYNFMKNNAFYKLPNYNAVQLKYTEYDELKNGNDHTSEPARPSTPGGTDHLIMNSYDVYYYINGTTKSIAEKSSEQRRYCSEYNANNKIKTITGYELMENTTPNEKGIIKGDTAVVYHYKKIPEIEIKKGNELFDDNNILYLINGENKELTYTYKLEFNGNTLDDEDVNISCSSNDENTVECNLDETNKKITLKVKKTISTPVTITLNSSEGTQFKEGNKSFKVLKVKNCMKGDINYDGRVTLLDIRIILQKILDNNYNDREKWIIDYNEDEEASLLDIRAILQYILNN